MKKDHHYQVSIDWQSEAGTSGYTAYQRDYTIRTAGKPDIAASSDPAFRGHPGRHNPEELLLASIAGCHMLWYLHLCAVNGVIVKKYRDQARAVMQEAADGGGRFTEVILYPEVTVTDPAMIDKATALHSQANQLCYIANSLNFAVSHQPRTLSEKA